MTRQKEEGEQESIERNTTTCGTLGSGSDDVGQREINNNNKSNFYKFNFSYQKLITITFGSAKKSDQVGELNLQKWAKEEVE